MFAEAERFEKQLKNFEKDLKAWQKDVDGMVIAVNQT
jgi:hypothetical protein